MKLIIQIPCLNEEETLPGTLADLPREVEGFETVEWLVIDDGSTDRTIEVAREHGVDHVVRLTNNKGLASGFQAGLDAALKLGADVIVNTDADNQYYGGDIPKLVAPILRGDADMVVGDREVMTIEHFSPLKKTLQRLGSWVVRRASETEVPDTTSGFRAYNREAALAMQVVSNYTYTLETIIQAGKMLIAVDHVPIATNPKTRESRLFPSMWSYIRRNGVSIFRVYSMYEPLRVFMTGAIIIGLIALVVWGRFFYFFAFEGEGSGHVQSLILGAVLFNAAMLLAALGIIGDLLSGQRIMLQRTFERVRRIELELGVPPSHYEPGARPTGPRADHRRPRRPPRLDRGARGGEAVSTVTRDAEGTVTGNTYDKYGSTNPVVKRLMAGFEGTLDELFAQADPQSLLDVGCGEAVLTHKWAQRLAPRRVVGIDLEDPAIQAEWETAPGAEPRVPGDEGREHAVRRRRVRRRDRDRGARARARPGAHGRRDGARGAAAGCSSRCRASRSGAGSTWRAAPTGRTSATPPGTSTTGPSARSCRCWPPRRGRRGALAVPVDDAARPALSEPREARPATAAAPASSRSASRPPGVVTFAYFSVASYVLDDVAYKQIALLWSVLFVTVSVIYRPIEQLLSRTIADRRARGLEDDHPLRTPLLIQGGFALAFLVVALALRGPIEDDLFDGSATLYWILVVAVLAYAASYFARGWLAGPPVVRALRRARVPGGVLAAAVRARGGGRDRRGADGGRARHGGGAVRVAGRRAVGVLAPAGRAGATRRTTRRRSGSRAAGASRSRCWRSCSPSRRCSTPACCWPTGRRRTPRWPASSSTCC